MLSRKPLKMHRFSFLLKVFLCFIFTIKYKEETEKCQKRELDRRGEAATQSVRSSQIK